MTQTMSADDVVQTLLTNQYGIVWDDDAPQVWHDLSSQPPRRVGAEVVVTASADVDRVLHEPGVFSSGPEGSFLGSESGLIPLQIDPPEHARYRRILDPMFSPKRVAPLEPGLRALMHECIDAFAGRGRCDFGREVAVPYPVGTFLDLLGLPQSGLPEFVRLKDDIIRGGVGGTLEQSMAVRRHAGAEISALFQEALTEREGAPRDDLLTALVERERAGDLSRENSINICHQLLIAGLDTVTGTLECAFGLLARRPDLQPALADPAAVPFAVEELLRWAATSPSQTRRAVQDADVGGVHIPAGTHVSVVQGTWNFDPDKFPDPLTVDLARPANRHATFGLGRHRCLGSNLARLELRIALEVWHQRIPAYRLAEGYEPVYSPVLRGIPDLQLEFDPR
ncbi:cytochrome P450 [Trujillonella endophytica]|uniref:Cytochrome P450 n=1 Tax=Trujillonella endophytica TaxID=673521 RepID=A0A1H8R0Q4_9ACTN|nr:cytochrome P450 [Trujillella endophytica]SEO59483.1 Cytochrome P450 [Trujillella endophytica]